MADTSVQVSCSDDTRALWEEFSGPYTTREAALRDLLRIAANYPQLPNRRREWQAEWGSHS